MRVPKSQLIALAASTIIRLPTTKQNLFSTAGGKTPLIYSMNNYSFRAKHCKAILRVLLDLRLHDPLSFQTPPPPPRTSSPPGYGKFSDATAQATSHHRALPRFTHKYHATPRRGDPRLTSTTDTQNTVGLIRRSKARRFTKFFLSAAPVPHKHTLTGWYFF